MTETLRDALRRRAAWAHAIADDITADCAHRPTCRFCAAAAEDWRDTALTCATIAVRHDLDREAR